MEWSWFWGFGFVVVVVFQSLFSTICWRLYILLPLYKFLKNQFSFLYVFISRLYSHWSVYLFGSTMCLIIIVLYRINHVVRIIFFQNYLLLPAHVNFRMYNKSCWNLDWNCSESINQFRENSPQQYWVFQFMNISKLDYTINWYNLVEGT